MTRWFYADDARKSYDSIAQFSKKDADTLPKWEAWMKGVSDVLGPLLLSVPPHLGSMKLGDLLPQAQTAWKMRKLGERGVADVTRLFTMSVSDLLDDWFESDAIKAMLTVNGVIGTWAGPDEPGTAYVMLHHSIGDVGDGHLGSWGFQQGGMGAVADSIRRSADYMRGLASQYNSWLHTQRWDEDITDLMAPPEDEAQTAPSANVIDAKYERSVA